VYAILKISSLKFLKNVGYNTDFRFLPQDLIPFYIAFPNLMHVSKNREGYNLIIVGTLKTNPLLEEAYAMIDVMRVTEGYLGEGKGVLEILSNPWNEEEAMLLVEGWDEWGYFTLFSHKTSDSYKISAEGKG